MTDTRAGPLPPRPRTRPKARIGDPTVPESVIAQALRTPDAVALEAIDGRLTYVELVAYAEAVADHLRDVGVAPGDVVAVALPRSVDLLPALLGVQLCGAAYLPLDRDHPRERLNLILRDARPRALLTHDTQGAGHDVETIVRISDIILARRPPRVAPPDRGGTAYVIYTSGSTGIPKGVAVGHPALANFMASMRETLRLPDNVVLPAITTASFDIAALELFLPLTTGGRVVLGEHADAVDPQRTAALIARTGATVLQATPTTWRLLLAAGWRPPAGFTVLCGGERLPTELVEQLSRHDVALWDLYGPTETTVWSSLTRYQDGVPIRFHAVRNTSLHVFDERLESPPPGVEGELYIGGRGLASGYLGQARLTAHRFVADPATDGGRLYRTGDLAQRQPDGRIEILGRTDQQIKIRGFRVEPAEIETAICRHPGIAAAAVTTETNADGPRLVAYVQAVTNDEPGGEPDERQLRLHLARSVPDHMIPAAFRAVEELPVTPNGKLDRSALAETQHGSAVATPEPAGASNEGELLVARVLAAVLEREHIGRHDDFFSLGGDSLRAVQAILRLNSLLETQVPINALFEMRTVYGLAQLLEDDGTPEPTLQRLPDDQPRRLSAAQWRLWLHQQVNPHSVQHNRALAVRIPENASLEAVGAAVTELVARHGTLRTCYRLNDAGVPIPVIAEPVESSPALEDAEPAEVVDAELSRPFDLAAAPAVRARVLRAMSGERFVVLVVHEIVADHRSRALFVRQLRAALRGRTVAPAAYEYVDFASWQREIAGSTTTKRHLDFWRTALAGLDPAELRTDRPRPVPRDPRAGSVPFTLRADVVARVHDFAAEHGAPSAVGMLTGLVAVLDRHTTGTDLTIGVHVDGGAEDPELQHTAGMFENLAVFRVATAGARTLGALLDRVRETAIGALGHAAPPIEDVVAATFDTVVPPAPGRNPLFDVSFALRAPTGLSDVAIPPPAEIPVDLHCELIELPDGRVTGRLDFSSAVLDHATVAGLATELVRVLEQPADAPVPECP